mgnify:CR=1 FL=1|tara:strand:- start:65 stop:829 length:765 start_codon:yes stop_codon:yes gene_type:complete
MPEEIRISDSNDPRYSKIVSGRHEEILNGIREWQSIKPGQWQTWDLPNIPILRSKLPEKAVDFLWKRIEESQEEYKSVKNTLVGNLSESLRLEDKDNYFFNNILKDTAESYVQTFPTGCSKNPFDDRIVNKLYLKSLWVNFSKKHEFNPIHDHNGVMSFVIWMRVPTEWHTQHELEMVQDSSMPCASNFQFFYQNIFGATRGINVEMDPLMEGCILLFPSLLQHQVYPFYENDGYRISISGNLCFDPKQLKDMV